MNGIIVLDKPQDITANRVLDSVKALVKQRKMGFLGTLDPLATGVLPLFLGKTTKILHEFEGLQKRYSVTIRLGQRTDTFDAQGTLLEERALGTLPADRVEKTLHAFQGSYQQLAPAFSALKHGGVPGYRLARQGKPVPPKLRQVDLSDLKIHSIDLPFVRFDITGSAGTYIRSLAEDIGQLLGVGAHVTVLRRLGCGTLFTLENSVTVEEITSGVGAGHTNFLRNPADFLPDHHCLTVRNRDWDLIKTGSPVPVDAEIGSLNLGDKAKAIGKSGELLAIGHIKANCTDGQSFRPSKVLI